MCEFCKPLTKVIDKHGNNITEEINLKRKIMTKETYNKILRVYSNEYMKIQIDGESIGKPYYKKRLKRLEKRIKGLIRDHSDLIKS